MISIAAYDNIEFVVAAGIFSAGIVFNIFIDDSYNTVFKIIILIILSAIFTELYIKILYGDFCKRLIIKRKFKNFILNYYSTSERYIVNLDKIVERFLHYEGFRGPDPNERTPYPTEKEVYIHFERWLYFSVHNYYEDVNSSNKARTLELANQMHAIYDKHLNYLFLSGCIKQEELQAKISQLNKEIAEYRF